MNYNDRLRDEILKQAEQWPGWTVTYEYPGYIAARLDRYEPYECAATPGWEGAACPLQVSHDGYVVDGRTTPGTMYDGPSSWSGSLEHDVQAWRLSVEAALCVAYGAKVVRELPGTGR
jgi:hypothetical protein